MEVFLLPSKTALLPRVSKNLSGIEELSPVIAPFRIILGRTFRSLVSLARRFWEFRGDPLSAGRPRAARFVHRVITMIANYLLGVQ